MEKIRENRIFALVFRIIAAAIGLMGTGILVWYVGIKTGSTTILTYFTIQTNIFCVMLFIVLAVKTAMQLNKGGKTGEIASINMTIQGAVTFFITITGVVYWGILSWASFGMGGINAPILKISNVIVHGLVPIFAVLDFIFFVPHGRLKAYDAFFWLSYPIAYFLFIVVRAQIVLPSYMGMTGEVSRYPYFFMDIDLLGWWFLPIFIGLAIGFYGLGRLYIFIDKKLAQKYGNHQNGLLCD